MSIEVFSRGWDACPAWSLGCWRKVRVVPSATVRTVSAGCRPIAALMTSGPVSVPPRPEGRTRTLPRWLIDATGVAALADDARVAPATAYRYVHEAL